VLRAVCARERSSEEMYDKAECTGAGR
jgi:hypothetical protein